MVAVICTSAFRRAVHGFDRRSAAIVDTTGAASAAPLMGISLGQPAPAGLSDWDRAELTVDDGYPTH